MSTVEYIIQHFEEGCRRGMRKSLRSLLYTLNGQELTILHQFFDSRRFFCDVDLNEPYYEFLKTCEELITPPEKSVVPKNEPISQLLKLFQDKKSKKVSISRNKLQDRYSAQSFSVQRKILKTFLASTKSDRKWAMGILLKNWDKYFMEDITRIWSTHHDYHSSRIIIKYFPQTFIFEHQLSLSVDTSYQSVCIRLMDHPDFVFQKENLYIDEYLYVMAKTGGKVDGLEVLEQMYDYLRNAAPTFTDEIDQYRFIEMKSFSSIYKKYEISIWSMGKLGLGAEIISLLNIETATMNRFAELMEENDFHGDVEIQVQVKIFRKAIYEILDGGVPEEMNQEAEIHSISQEECQHIMEKFSKKNPAMDLLVQGLDLEPLPF